MIMELEVGEWGVTSWPLCYIAIIENNTQQQLFL